MKLFIRGILVLTLTVPALAQDYIRSGELLGRDDDSLIPQLLALPTGQSRANLFFSTYPEKPTLENCVNGSIDTWRLRRCCTDQAAYAWQDTIPMVVTDRITNWNTFPWTFAGTTKAILGTDTLPHTVNLRIKDMNNQTILNWETTVTLVPGNWSYSVPFLWWVETLRNLRLIGFSPSSYLLIAELRATGYQGISIEVPFTIDYPTFVLEDVLTSGYELKQNYPNPFNSMTVIRFSLPVGANVKLAIFNLLGQEVRCLANQWLNSGTHSLTFEPGDLPSGIYFYRLTSGNTVATKKMAIAK